MSCLAGEIVRPISHFTKSINFIDFIYNISFKKRKHSYISTLGNALMLSLEQAIVHKEI